MSPQRPPRATVMPAHHWIGPQISPREYLASNKGLYELDDRGILITLYRDQLGPQGKPRIEYNPGFVANYAITACRQYVRQADEDARKILVGQLDWLLQQGQAATSASGPALLFPYRFDWHKFDLKAPWVSAFAQALIGNAFACGADATGSDQYRQAARQALAALQIRTQEGGVTTWENGTAWFEEAAKERFPSVKILNGHLTAMEGLLKYLQWSPDPKLQALWEAAIRATKAALPAFDAGYMSYYAQFPPGQPDQWELSGRLGYNTIHTIQLVSLYEATGDAAFLEQALRFAEYETPALRVTTAGSTAPETNGADRINMVMGNDYWSHGVFPTTVNIDMGRTYGVTGLYLVAHTASSSPRDYTILASVDGRRYRRVASASGNERQRMRHVWPWRQARYLRVVIRSDNGNQNVTLKGVYPMRPERPFAVVGNSSAMSVNNMPAALFAGRPWNPQRTGWVLMRNSRPGAQLQMRNARGGVIHVRSGADLHRQTDWAGTRIECAEHDCSFTLPPAGDFVRLEWDLPAGTRPSLSLQ